MLFVCVCFFAVAGFAFTHGLEMVVACSKGAIMEIESGGWFIL